MFGPLRERIEAAVEKVEGMLVGFSFSFFDLTLSTLLSKRGF